MAYSYTVLIELIQQKHPIWAPGLCQNPHVFQWDTVHVIEKLQYGGEIVLSILHLEWLDPNALCADIWELSSFDNLLSPKLHFYYLKKCLPLTFPLYTTILKRSHPSVFVLLRQAWEFDLCSHHFIKITFANVLNHLIGGVFFSGYLNKPL